MAFLQKCRLISIQIKTSKNQQYTCRHAPARVCNFDFPKKGKNKYFALDENGNFILYVLVAEQALYQALEFLVTYKRNKKNSPELGEWKSAFEFLRDELTLP